MKRLGMILAALAAFISGTCTAFADISDPGIGGNVGTFVPVIIGAVVLVVLLLFIKARK